MAYLRCDCHVGDVEHPDSARHITIQRFGGKKTHHRCTRRATMSVRRVVDTRGRRIPGGGGPWYRYCEKCARAIRAYQGSTVELRDGVDH